MSCLCHGYVIGSRFVNFRALIMSALFCCAYVIKGDNPENRWHHKLRDTASIIADYKSFNLIR
jgi:hypothetical protein